MNIQTRNLQKFQTPRTTLRTPAASDTSQQPSDSVTLSGSSDRFATARKAVGGGVAGAVYSGLLSTLGVSLIPTFGGTAQLAGRVFLGAMVAGGVAGAAASATMPEGKNWY